ncbi:MAG: hypothetical protein ACRD2U_11370, partial [Terriglobales bacterium]
IFDDADFPQCIAKKAASRRQSCLKVRVSQVSAEKRREPGAPGWGGEAAIAMLGIGSETAAMARKNLMPALSATRGTWRGGTKSGQKTCVIILSFENRAFPAFAKNANCWATTLNSRNMI